MIRDMLRLAIWGVTRRKSDIIATLHDLGILHLDPPKSLDITSPQLDRLKLLRGKLLGVLEALEWTGWATLKESDISHARYSLNLPFDDIVSEISHSLDQFSNRLGCSLNERKDLQDLYVKLKNAHEILLHFHSFLRKDISEGYYVSLWWMNKTDMAEALTLIRNEISRIAPIKTGEYMRYHPYIQPDREMLVAVAVNEQFSEMVSRIMESCNGALWKAPSGYERENILETSDAIEEGLNLLPEKRRELESDLKNTAQIWGPKLAAIYILADEKLEEIFLGKMAHSLGDAFLIEGWIPADELEKVLSSLRENYGSDVFVQWRYPSAAEWNDVPISLSNSTLSRPFELFLKLLQPPRYKTTDPTSAIALFFPLFGGCMVGDVGYGLLIFLLGFSLRKRSQNRICNDLGVIVIFMAIWSIAWGVAYGEFFGDVGHRLFGMEPLWVERSHAVMPVMILTIVMGAAHIILGLFIGLYEGIKTKRRHVWMEKTGNLCVLFALIGALVTLKGWLPQEVFTIALSSLIIGLILLIAGGGIGGLVESMGAIGNILSYVRIAAIGLSSAILALVASKFIDVFGLSLLGIFLALSVHLLNFVLAIGGASIHSARLHYVEFMGKFYSGGGKDYKPFSRGREFRWRRG